MTDMIRRKIDRARLPVAEGVSGVDRDWRLALARAARDMMGLELEVRRVTITRASLAEVLEIAPDHALVALLDGPDSGLGVLFMAPSVTSAMIEMQTIGRLSAQAPAPRKPTRIDAFMVAGLIDRALAGLEQNLASEADLIWAGGFRYASHLEDIRPLSLLLEDEPYRVLTTEIGLGAGRDGKIILVLPAEGRGRRPVSDGDGAEDAGLHFTTALAEQVMHAGSVLDGVVGRLRLPLGRIMALQTGDVLALPAAALDAISLDTLEGRSIARARLGQNRGMRALKLYDMDSDRRAATASPALPVASGRAPEPEKATELRPTG